MADLGGDGKDPVTKEAGVPDPAQLGKENGKPAMDATAGPEPETDTVSDRASPNGSHVQEVFEDPVEILVGMAERGEIDPWNINIIEVTDRFLSELKHRQQLNLHVSGRTLFFASTLLRMKSEQLSVAGDEGDEGEGEDLFGDEYGGSTDEDIDLGGRLGPIERLEHEIQRRLDRKSMRKSPITLFELITELKNIEKEERRRRRMATDSSPDSLIDADDVVNIAHDEGYQESSMTRLAEYLEGLEIDEEMTLAELCQRMEWGIPEVYIPLLFLALDGRCNLRQEEFFGDIFVQICRVEGEESGTETAD
jgi:segregation and condensation protein A